VSLSFLGPICRQADAVCEYGCQAGHYTRVCNATCQSQCIDDTCNITSGVCTECGRPNPGMMCPEGSKCPHDSFPRVWCKAVLRPKLKLSLCALYRPTRKYPADSNDLSEKKVLCFSLVTTIHRMTFIVYLPRQLQNSCKKLGNQCYFQTVIVF